MRLAGDWAPKLCKVMPLPWSDRVMLVNLEGPVIQDQRGFSPSPKAGPHLAHQYLPQTNANIVFTLANNHIMDYGPKALAETQSHIWKAGFRCIGAGSNADSAALPLMIDYDEMRIGIIARCEEQFGSATQRSAGVSPLSPSIFRAIRSLKSECDVVIVSVHAAAEMCPWPSPRRQETWRALIEAGADIVHGHHAHVPQGWEHYEGGIIFYGLGNLCVDPVSWSIHPNTLWSLVPRLSWESRKLCVDAETAVIEDMDGIIRVRASNATEVINHQDYLTKCNFPLANHALLKGLWHEASVRMYHAFYEGWIAPAPPPRSSLHQRARLIVSRARKILTAKSKDSNPNVIGQCQRLLLYVLFSCDSHSDAISTALGVLNGELEDCRNAETIKLVDELMPGFVVTGSET